MAVFSLLAPSVPPCVRADHQVPVRVLWRERFHPGLGAWNRVAGCSFSGHNSGLSTYLEFLVARQMGLTAEEVGWRNQREIVAR